MTSHGLWINDAANRKGMWCGEFNSPHHTVVAFAGRGDARPQEVISSRNMLVAAVVRRQVHCSITLSPQPALSPAPSAPIMPVSQAASSATILLDLVGPTGALPASSLFATPGTLLTTCVASVPQEATVRWRTSYDSIAASMARAERSSWAHSLRSSLIASVAG